MSESDGIKKDAVNNAKSKETKGSYLSDQFISIIFPFAALWYGPKYLIKREYLKGVIILAIFAIELYIIFSVL